MNLLPIIPLARWALSDTPFHPVLNPNPRDDIVFETASRLLAWIAEDIEERANPARSAFETTVCSHENYRSWRRARALISDLKAYRKYRTSAGSRHLNQAALNYATATERSEVDALVAEIEGSGFTVPAGQILFTGKAYDTPPSGSFMIGTFLSTTLCPSVAACHARDQAFHQQVRGYVIIIETSLPVPALFVPIGNPDEYEVLIAPGTCIQIRSIEANADAGFDVVVAELSLTCP